MAYSTYTTEALVCGTFDRNTADRSYLLFTRDAGMLYADARSVREERSRQRYALQDFSLVRVSLVKGKRSWKIGSIQAITNYYTVAVDKTARGSVVSICRSLRRFISGEEATPALFDYLKEALGVVSGVVEHRAWVEQIIQVRLLTELGYVDRNKTPPLVVEAQPTQIDANYSKDVIKQLDKLLSQAVSSSHL